MNVVLLEDEELAGQALKELLTIKGFNCQHFTTAEETLAHPCDDVDVYILDYHLHGKPEGGDVAKKLRQSGFRFPILMLTSEKDEKIVVSCFEQEVDDYINKPVRCEELVARIDRHLCKAGRTLKNIIKHNDLVLNPEKKEAHVNGVPVHLTPSEYKILHFMLQNRGRIICRQDLIQFINEENIVVGRRTIDTHINAIRKKIPDKSVKITAKRSFGYGIL